jgi:hypothetical protein
MIFLDNKYTRWYWSIVASARSRAPNTNEIYDRHHIIPRSLDGNDNEDNLVNVTLREHFVLHRLLCHMTEGRAKRSMYWALHRMLFSRATQHIANSRLFETFRKEFIAMIKASPHYKTPEWSRKMSDVVTASWAENIDRRKKASEQMRDKWRRGIITSDQRGEKNHMWGKTPASKGKKFPGTGKSGSKNSQAKVFTIRRPTGEIDVTDCLRTYCETANLSYACMVQVSRGKNKQHRGYTIMEKRGKACR